MPSGKSYDLREKAKDAASPYAGDKSKSPAKAAGAPASPSKAAPASPSKAAAPASPSKASHAPASPTKLAAMASPARPVSPTGTKPTSAAAGHASPSRIPIPTPVGQAHAHAHGSGSSPTTKPASPTKQLRDQVNKEVAKLGGSIQSKVLPNHGVVPKVTTKTVVQSQTPARSPTAGSPTKPASPSGKAAASSSSAASGSAKLGVQAQPTVGKTPQKAGLTPDQIKKGLTHAGATSSPKSHSK